MGYERLEENSLQKLPEEDFYLAGLPKIQCSLKAMLTTDSDVLLEFALGNNFHD